jgi:hypothetical protein
VEHGEDAVTSSGLDLFSAWDAEDGRAICKPYDLRSCVFHAIPLDTRSLDLATVAAEQAKVGLHGWQA